MLRIDRPPVPAETSRTQRVARAALALGLGILGLWTLRSFLPALVWAAIFAIATWPSFERAQRRGSPGKHNIILPACFTMVIAMLFLVPLGIVAVQLGREAHSLFLLIDDARKNGIPVPDFIPHLPLAGQQVRGWWQENLADPAGAHDLLVRISHGEVVGFSRNLGSLVVHRIVLFASRSSRCSSFSGTDRI